MHGNTVFSKFKGDYESFYRIKQKRNKHGNFPSVEELKLQYNICRFDFDSSIKLLASIHKSEITSGSVISVLGGQFFCVRMNDGSLKCFSDFHMLNQKQQHITGVSSAGVGSEEAWVDHFQMLGIKQTVQQSVLWRPWDYENFWQYPAGMSITCGDVLQVLFHPVNGISNHPLRYSQLFMWCCLVLCESANNSMFLRHDVIPFLLRHKNVAVYHARNQLPLLQSGMQGGGECCCSNKSKGKMSTNKTQGSNLEDLSCGANEDSIQVCAHCVHMARLEQLRQFQGEDESAMDSRLDTIGNAMLSRASMKDSILEYANALLENSAKSAPFRSGSAQPALPLLAELRTEKICPFDVTDNNKSLVVLIDAVLLGNSDSKSGDILSFDAADVILKRVVSIVQESKISTGFLDSKESIEIPALDSEGAFG